MLRRCATAKWLTPSYETIFTNIARSEGNRYNITMIITGTAILIENGSTSDVIQRLKNYSEVTFQVHSECGTELIINMETDDQRSLEALCARIKDEIPQVIDIAHVYFHMESEVEKLTSGAVSDSSHTQND
jgi:nitrate reductase NapAB chaperone NapD